MALKKSVLNAINKQITTELHSAYVYLAMSTYFEEQSFKGFASWMKKQFEEEQHHASKFQQYVADRDAEVVFSTLKAPVKSWKKPLDVFKAALKHEQFVTKSIHDLLALARKEKDYATEQLLQWYVEEQVEEEANAQEAVDKLTLAGSNPDALLRLDREFGKRE